VTALGPAPRHDIWWCTDSSGTLKPANDHEMVNRGTAAGHQELGGGHEHAARPYGNAGDPRGSYFYARPDFGMKREAYSAARTIAPKLHAYFSRRRVEAIGRSQECLAPLPDAESIEAVIDAAFWASLRREEGYEPRISLAIVPPDQAQHPLVLQRPLPLGPDALARVAPAVERPGVHLGVWRDQGELSVWGTTRTIPVLSFVLEVAAPGLLVVKHHSGEESRKFINVAVLEGDLIKVVDDRASSQPDCPKLLTSLLGFDSPSSWIQSVNAMAQLAVSMRAHGRGGSLLVVPAGTDAWRESIVQPMPYAISPPFLELAQLSRQSAGPMERHVWEEALGPTVAAVAGLTAVDGALILTDRYELLGFGAKIARRTGCPQVEQIMLTEPIEGASAVLVHPEQLGGTRHLSAAQFIQDQRDAVALVASQDGRFTIFEWSSCEAMVHAHRVDVLLL
jgi:sensor domain DACNV-containing protein